jgi:hypothetical protein
MDASGSAQQTRTLWLGARRFTRVVATAIAAALVALPLGLAVPAVRADQHGESPSLCAPDVHFLGFSEALNKTTFGGYDVVELSGLAYDPQRDVYYAVADRAGPVQTHVFTLSLPLAGGVLGVPTILEVMVLHDANGAPLTGAGFDGEGVALAPGGGLLIASEGGSAVGEQPELRHFSEAGADLGELPIPTRFLVGTNNLSLESLAMSPSGQSLFTANEQPLPAVEGSPEDGQTTDLRNRIRILRYEHRDDGGFVPAAQFYYATEPDRAPGDVGVVDLIAVSETTLMVLERGFVEGQGNTVRLFRVSLEGAPDVSEAPTLATPELVPLVKSPVFDLADCPPVGATTPPGATQPNALLDNVEGMALGPALPDGRRAVLLISDDNAGPTQVTRVIAVSVPEPDAAGSP